MGGPPIARVGPLFGGGLSWLVHRRHSRRRVVFFSRLNKPHIHTHEKMTVGQDRDCFFLRRKYTSFILTAYLLYFIFYPYPNLLSLLPNCFHRVGSAATRPQVCIFEYFF